MLIRNILFREAKIIKNTASGLLTSVISSLIIICIFLLILEEKLSDPVITYGLIIIVSTLNIFSNDYISDDFKSGIIEQIFLLPISQFKVVLIKLGMNFIEYILVHLPLWFMICSVLKVEFYYLQYILFTFNLMSIALLITVISISLPPRKNLMSNVLLLPIIFPQIILSILSVIDINHIYLCLSVSILTIPIFLIFSTVILQNAISEDC